MGPAKQAPGASKPTPLKSGSKPAGYSKLAAPNGSRSSYADRYTTAPKTSSLPPGKISKSSAPPGSGSAPVARPSSVAAKKRPRSTSRSESPPPKRRVPSPGLGTISSQIWEIFGRKRDDYVGKDVLSDDDEMEADATLMEREEKQRLGWIGFFVIRFSFNISGDLVPASPKEKNSRLWRRSDATKKRNAGAAKRRRLVSAKGVAKATNYPSDPLDPLPLHHLAALVAVY